MIIEKVKLKMGVVFTFSILHFTFSMLNHLVRSPFFRQQSTFEYGPCLI